MTQRATPLVLVAALLLLAGCTSPLMIAARKGDLEAARKAIDEGANVNERNNDKDTPLTLASIYGNKDLIEFLLSKGADITAGDLYFGSPLNNAVRYGKKDNVEFLISKGADVNVKSGSYFPRTPLILAAEWGHKDIAKLLLDKGADPTIGDPRGSAERSGNPDIARIIKEALDEGPRRIENAKQDPQEEAKFAKAAQEYRTAATKPALPEEARKYKVQAEEMVRDKKYEKAAELYGQALAIAPWWPEGHYNRAIVLGESRYYQGAMREMKRYLTLVPNAPDARAAQDKIYAWEAKAGK